VGIEWKTECRAGIQEGSGGVADEEESVRLLEDRAFPQTVVIRTFNPLYFLDEEKPDLDPL
jgi:phenylalanine-4-hydroxylase